LLDLTELGHVYHRCLKHINGSVFFIISKNIQKLGSNVATTITNNNVTVGSISQGSTSLNANGSASPGNSGGAGPGAVISSSSGANLIANIANSASSNEPSELTNSQAASSLISSSFTITQNLKFNEIEKLLQKSKNIKVLNSSATVKEIIDDGFLNKNLNVCQP
jgi:hypothetical protein